MSPAEATVASGIFSGIVLIAVTLITARNNRKGEKATETLAERVVDREEWESYTQRQDAERERLERRIADLERRLETEVTARKAAERRATEAERRADAAERKATDLEERVTHLEEVNEKLREDLAIATRLLEQKYPDEPDEAPDLS